MRVKSPEASGFRVVRPPFRRPIRPAVSGYFPENPWRLRPEIWCADVSCPPSEMNRFWSWSVDFHGFCVTFNETGQIWCFWAKSGKCMEGMT